jgi:hypothetical protein
MTATKTYILKSNDGEFDVTHEDGQPIRSVDDLNTAFDTFVDLLAGKDLFDCGVRS